jgi:hypothetical protein
MNIEEYMQDFQVLVSTCAGTSHEISFIKKTQQWKITMSQHYEKGPIVGPQRQVSFAANTLQQCLALASDFIRSKRRGVEVKFTTIKQ